MTWHPSDLTTLGLRRALVLLDPHLCLSTWGATWVLTGPDGSTRTGLARDAALELVRGYGAEEPTGAEMEWAAA